MSEITLFDRHGKAIAYIVEDGAIYTWAGRAQCYLSDDKVYGWNGHHLGFIADGTIFDLRGKRVGFTQQTCPVMTKMEPMKHMKKMQKMKHMKKMAKMRPMLSMGHSAASLEQFLQAGER